MKVSEKYKTLYHYTTCDGLMGILKNRSLWATHHRFLNDYSETFLMKDKLIDLAKPIIHQEYRSFVDNHPDSERINQIIKDEGGFDVLVDRASTVIISGMYKTLPSCDGFYITAFCGESKNEKGEIDQYISKNGLLSQWRGYGQDGGYVLVFDTKALETLLDKESECYNYNPGSALGAVVYSDDEEEFKREFAPQLPHMRGYIGAMIKCLFVRELDPNINKNYPDALRYFVNCISLYKHRGFKEENEVRICAYPAAHTMHENPLRPEKERKFRNKNGECIPYIELFSSLNQDLPIKRIIVGPHKNKNARVSALRVMLRGSEIEVTASDIPFVG